MLYSLLSEKDFYKNALIVHLNGLIHTDDRIALKAATVQMKLENAVEGKVFGSFAENLSFLLACLKSGDKSKSKSVVFILEEFDMFCAHHNQTLLYNLFDVSQSAQTPICVLGITCRLDVVELLEKRVKSRFSHRQVFLSPSGDDFNERVELFKELMRLPTEKELRALEPRSTHLVDLNSSLCFLRNIFEPKNYKFSKTHVEKWNKHIESLASSVAVKTVLEYLYDIDVTEVFFKNFLYRLVSKLNPDHSELTVDDISKVASVYNTDGKVLLLNGLSVLELCLIIAIKHHSTIYDRDPFNFEIILGRFNKFAKTSTSMQGVERAVILKAYEHLKNLEIISPVSGGAAKVQKEFQMNKLMLTYGQIDQAVAKYPALPTEVAQWAQSSIA